MTSARPAAKRCTTYARSKRRGQAVGADPLGCTRDAKGACVEVSPCFSKPWSDDCLSETEERAWSSPIFVNQGVDHIAAQANPPETLTFPYVD